MKDKTILYLFPPIFLLIGMVIVILEKGIKNQLLSWLIWTLFMGIYLIFYKKYVYELRENDRRN